MGACTGDLTPWQVQRQFLRKDPGSCNLNREQGRPGHVLVTGEHISRVEAEDYGKISVPSSQFYSESKRL